MLKFQTVAEKTANDYKGKRIVDFYSASTRSVCRRSGIARIVEGYHSFTCTPCVSSASGISCTCLCLPSHTWYTFTEPGGMKGWVDLGAKWSRPRFEPATSRLQIRHSTTEPLAHLIGGHFSAAPGRCIVRCPECFSFVCVHDNAKSCGRVWLNFQDRYISGPTCKPIDSNSCLWCHSRILHW